MRNYHAKRGFDIFKTAEELCRMKHVNEYFQDPEEYNCIFPHVAYVPCNNNQNRANTVNMPELGFNIIKKKHIFYFY